jgi:chromosome segregation ATPase
MTTSADKLHQQLKKYKQDLKKAQIETRQLRKHVMQLNEELESSEAEVKAQQAELARAAERMEKDRARANEDRDELMDEQEEELENQKAQYEKELKEQKERYDDQVEELEERLTVLEQKRMQEGGDWTKELEDTIQREREAIKKVNSLKDENAKLKSAMTKLETQQSALQAKLESSIEANHNSSNREREAEDRLDAALSLHSRQLSQRQAREAELERAIADLGAALARSRQKEKTGTVQTTDSSSMKEQLEAAIDELETVRAQLLIETERSDALRNELHDISKERTAEASESQARQRQLTREVSDLKSTVSRLQASTRDRKGASVAMTGDTDASEVYQQLEEAKLQMSLLSEQLMKHQDADQNAKQEIMALKARLQSASSRAESAENALVTATSARSAFEVEGGTTFPVGSMRRRVKGGRSRGPASVRSIRTSLGIRPGHANDGMEHVAVTIDAIDAFLVDAGSLMKNEPLLRLGFVLYLCVLHLWSFCLVVFHASSYEDVHGDFGSMSDPESTSSLMRNNQP